MLTKIIEEAKKEVAHVAKYRLTNHLVTDTQMLQDFLSQSLTKGIQKVIGEIKLDRKQEASMIHTADMRMISTTGINLLKNKGYNQACEDLEVKINKILQ